MFPSLLKQDPRFFYKSSGSVRSRILYALGASLMAKGDNGRWQPNYSNFLGDLASGGLSNLYYPPQDRNGVALTFENVGISMGARAADYLMQEFLVPKLTRKAPHFLIIPIPSLWLFSPDRPTPPCRPRARRSSECKGALPHFMRHGRLVPGSARQLSFLTRK